MTVPTIIFTVTTDLTYDQRMQRICGSLANNGFKVLIVGRKLKTSIPLGKTTYSQKRLPVWFKTGKLMYLEYNFRLILFLLFQKADCLCAIDLDTILPCYFVSVLKKTKRVYDAHELFTEQKEIVTRPAIYKLWLNVERFAVPRFQNGYTVNGFIKGELNKRYGVSYEVVRNLPVLSSLPQKVSEEKIILYQGAVNEGRSFETLIPAMKKVQAKLVICGNGNYFNQVKELIAKYDVAEKVELKGVVPPHDLSKITPQATIAVMLFEKTGLNQYQSLSNRFFDYIMGGVPQVCVAYPEYEAINDKFKIAYLINNTNSDTISDALNLLLDNDVLYNSIRENCLHAREILNWNNEEKVLIHFYNDLFSLPDN